MATSYHFGGHLDPEDETMDPQELLATVAHLYLKQAKLEERLSYSAEALKLLQEARRIAALSTADLQLLAAEASRPTPIGDAIAYRLGRIFADRSLNVRAVTGAIVANPILDVRTTLGRATHRRELGICCCTDGGAQAVQELTLSPLAGTQFGRLIVHQQPCRQRFARGRRFWRYFGRRWRRWLRCLSWAGWCFIHSLSLHARLGGA